VTGSEDLFHRPDGGHRQAYQPPPGVEPGEEFDAWWGGMLAHLHGHIEDKLAIERAERMTPED
jgi:hypothetical protein